MVYLFGLKIFDLNFKVKFQCMIPGIFPHTTIPVASRRHQQVVMEIIQVYGDGV